MKKYLIYLFIICIFTVCGCNEQEKTHENISYLIDLDSGEKDDTIRLSTFFKRVNAIILEDHEYAVIGDIFAIQIFENLIFVLDKLQAKKLFVYDKTGKYVRQIGRLGQGPGEYSGISDFCINFKHRKIYLLDDRSKKIHKYDLDNGKYINSIKLSNDMTYRYIACSSEYLFCSIRPYDRENDNLLMKITEQGKCEEYLSANIYNAGWNRLLSNGFNFFVSKGESLKYMELFMNTLISIDDGIVSAYMQVKHKDWVKKEDFLSQEEYLKQRLIERVELGKKGKAFTVNNYFEWQNYIFFQYSHGLGLPVSVLYDKQTAQVTQYKYLKNDLLFDNTFGARFFYVNSEAAYDYYESSNFPAFYGIEDGDISDLDISPNLLNKDDIVKLSEERFIIFEYEFK